MRSEGDRLLEAVDELIEISRQSGAPAEIYHLKQARQDNWDKLDAVIARIEAARAAGLRITADMYTYTAGATGLDAAMPPWVQAGGLEAWIARLKDPATRAKVHRRDARSERRLGEPRPPRRVAGGRPAGRLQEPGAQAAHRQDAGRGAPRTRGVSPRTRPSTWSSRTAAGSTSVYFLMSEDNVRRQTALPWMSFGSDAEAPGARGRVPAVDHPPARLRQLRPLAGQVRARREDA